MSTKWIIVIIAGALLLSCVGIGVIAFFVFFPTGINSLQILPDRVPGISARATEEQAFAVDGPASLVVENLFGDVQVQAAGEGAEGQILMVAEKTAWGYSQEEAEQALEKMVIITEQDGNRVTIRIERNRQLQLANTNRANSIDFTITVPVETAVEVSNQSGDVQLNGTQGPAQLRSAFGQVVASDVDGALDLESRSGAVSARRIDAGSGNLVLNSAFGNVALEDATGGRVQVSSRSGGLTLNNVQASGDIVLDSDFGAITYRQGQGANLQVEAGSGAVELSQIVLEGELSVYSRFGNVTVNRVDAGGYELEAESGKVSVTGVQGKVTVRSNFGDIEVTDGISTTLDLETQSGGVTYRGSLGEGPHRLHTDFGDVRITLPADSAFDFDLETGFGDIHSGFDVTLSGELNEKHWVGKVNGGGSRLAISTRNGGISIEKSAR